MVMSFRFPSLLLVVGLVWLVTAVPVVQAKADLHTIYRIIPRGSVRNLIDQSLEVPSFDGDLDRIQQLALAESMKSEGNSPSISPTFSTLPTNKLVPTVQPSDLGTDSPSASANPSDAPSIEPTIAPTKSGAPSDSPSSVPSTDPFTTPSPTNLEALTTSSPVSVLDSSTLIACPNADESVLQMQTVTFLYSVETAPLTNVAAVTARLEQSLALEMVPLLLECWDPAYTFDFSVQAIDPLPDDIPSSNDVCTSASPGVSCTVYRGSTRVFTPNPEEGATIIFESRTAIQSILDNPTFHVRVPGLLQSTYLGPTIVAPTPFQGFAGGSSDTENLGTTSFVLVAIGSAALIVFVGSIYYMKRENSESSDGAATQAAGSSLYDHHYDPDAERPASPFSEMLPSAYRYNDNMSILSGHQQVGLEAVIEQNPSTDEESPSPGANTIESSSIMVSESGYTTEAAEDDSVSLSFGMPTSLYRTVAESPELLGARKRRESVVTKNASILVDPNMSDDSMGDVMSDDVINESLLWTPTKSPGELSADDNDHTLLGSI